MRKTIMLGAIVALFGTGALAQAKDVTATEQKTAAEATQTDTPAVRDENAGERRSAAHAQNREARDGACEHNDETVNLTTTNGNTAGATDYRTDGPLIDQ